ncbi:MAG: hypothetical protein IJX87_01270 [Clostridia bacterium]|nr:hypothetical protein [Clostridia bacterium]
MRSEEFITSIMQTAKDNEKFEEVRRNIPIGKDSVGNIVVAQKRKGAVSLQHTCVTGAHRVGFIKRLLITLSCLYEPSDACFMVLSPRQSYGDLLRLNHMDVTVPYIRSKSDLALAKDTVRELAQMYETGAQGYPKFFLVLDGLEELPECNENNDFAEYREFMDIAMRKNIEVISGIDLMKSIFSGYPGAFIGIGNCLITTTEKGKADVTYVSEDTSLTRPLPMNYPDQPTVAETITFLNALSHSNEEGA